MTDEELKAAILASPAAVEAASAGKIADTVAVLKGKPVPVTIESLAAAAPDTMKALSGSADAFTEAEEIVSRILNSDVQGIGRWSQTMKLIGKMSDVEFAAVSALVAAAAVIPVDDNQVARAIHLINPPKQMRSHEDAPGSWFVMPQIKPGTEKDKEPQIIPGKFVLFWDGQPQADAPIFDSMEEGEAWMMQWYADHLPVEVKEVVVIDPIDVGPMPVEILKA